jgi:hypothetical protein
MLALLAGVCAVLAGCAETFEAGDGGGGDGGGVCQPGEGKCVGQRIYTCGAAGAGWRAGKLCEWPESCNLGACTDPCSMAKAERSYVGCEYFAVDLDNIPSSKGYSPRDAQFAIVVSYAGSSEHAVGVKVFSMVGGKEKVVAEGTVAPGGVRIFKVGPQNVTGTVKGVSAFRVSAAAPVTVYQFNPLNNTLEAFSNDASLLLPVPSLDKEYIAVTGDGVLVSDMYDKSKTYKAGAFVTVVGVTDDTKVTITPSAALAAGSGIPGGKKPVTRTINRYEVLSVASDVAALAKNLSGTLVKADKPVAVFAGNGATVVPNNSAKKCCADHLEEQMIPLSAWGKTFVAGRTRPRKTTGTPEADWWRLTGGAKGIKLTYSPAAPKGAPATLDRGQSAHFSSTTSFVVQASGPVLLTQFMTSANTTGEKKSGAACTADAQCGGLGFEAVCDRGYCGPVGDPAMILVPPVEQFRSDYVFLVPDDYYKDYATFIVPVDATLTLDKATVNATPTPVGTINGTSYGLVYADLSDGKHRVSASKPFGVLAYGLDAYVSYGYPAGLDLKRINID